MQPPVTSGIQNTTTTRGRKFAFMSMQDIIQDSLDDLSSTHSSLGRKGRALNNLEKLLADICVPSGEDAAKSLSFFVALQDTFQCNVPSRLLAWLSETAARLDVLTGKGSLDSDRETEATTLSSQLIQALMIIQGVALNHPASKQYLGRRYAIEVLLDLLLTSRHVSPTPLSASTNVAYKSSDESRNKKSGSIPISLASAVLDTLLCILVDSSPALRVFEDTNGVQCIVKILKRAGTPREVRMKCLEFLYFYLLDETATPNGAADCSDTSMIPTAPNSPMKASNRSATSLSHSSDSSISSLYSVDSSTTAASYSTCATSFSSTSFNGSSTPLEPSSPPRPVDLEGEKDTKANNALGIGLKPSPRIITPPQPRSLLMLRKDVDFVPLSPKKAQITRLGVGTPRQPPSRQRSLLSSEEVDLGSREQAFQTPKKAFDRTQPQSCTQLAEDTRTPIAATSFQKGHRRAQSTIDVRSPPHSQVPERSSSCIAASGTRSLSSPRTMEEKKEILGSMLGNVDALVEGVRKAGIWGLG